MEKLITTHLVKNFDIGTNGNLYGGRMLDWLDEAGGLFVHGLFDEYFVTWKFGEAVFHKPVKQGAIVKIYVKNVDIRTSSVGLDVIAKVDGTEVLTTAIVFVCVDPETGIKKAIKR